MSELARQFVAEARRMLGVRWVHQGRGMEGVDCIGLPIVCAQKVYGLQFPMPDYSPTTQDETMLRMCRQLLIEVPVVQAQPGDIAVLGFERQRHMAIIGDYPGGGLTLIHAYLPNRKVVEARLDDVWRSRILSLFRMPED